ncbi:MAG TPA: PhoD-like phosphatase N-terminal domain-containing protein, partial [Thermoleophilaceae bacterium]
MTGHSRRAFLWGAGGLAAATAFRGADALADGPRRRRPSLRGGRFAEGVMSGDPTPDAITLWTRVADVEGSGTVVLEVARDHGFGHVVARELVRVSAASAYSVKVRVGGLRPYEQYWYRFATRGEESAVGRFRTALPADSRQPVRFAFLSCQDWTFGFYNAHRLLAKEDVDFVV